MARQRYYGEKFKPTKGAFGGTSKFNRRLNEEAKTKALIEENLHKQTEKKKESSKSDKKVEDSKEAKTGNDNDLNEDGN
jgi:hypothetical protein